MRIYFLHGDHESGPFGLEDLRDRLDLLMIAPSQPCRIAGRPGRFVAGEIVAGELFRAWDREDEADEEAIQTDREEDEPDEDGDPLEDDGFDPGEEEEVEEEEESELLWSGHPGLVVFPAHLGGAILLVALAAASWFLEWSGWMATGFAALACFAIALLLARRQSVHYELYDRRAQCTSGLIFTRVREVPRRTVDAIDVRTTLSSGLGGRGDVVFHCATPRGPEEFVFRQVYRPARVRQLWR